MKIKMVASKKLTYINWLSHENVACVIGEEDSLGMYCIDDEAVREMSRLKIRGKGDSEFLEATLLAVSVIYMRAR